MRSAGLLLLLGCASLARAEPEQRPWAVGVSADNQELAMERFERGNERLDQGLFVQALQLYREAIAAWDHPAIRYNVAVALINLERPLDAYDELERALAHGEQALEPDVYLQALAYQRLLGGQIVRLAIECVEPATHVQLDGNELAMSCPGTKEQRVLPGRHRVVANKPGFVTRQHELAPSGGETVRVSVDLMTDEEATITRRRWDAWKPWAVVSGGVAIGLVGLGFELQSAATFRSYDRAIATLCPDMPCESIPDNVSDAYDRGRTQTKVAAGLFIAGGATVVTGAVLLWLNRAISERIGYDRKVVTARIGTDGGFAAAGWAF
jgi:tetratricopeptide (TPR) repeat protein